MRVLFHINTAALPSLKDLPYLGRTITYNNSNWTLVYQNLDKARRQRRVIVRVLAKKGAMVWACGMVYKVMTQLVLLYFSESWLVTGVIPKVLWGFHNPEARHITGMLATCGAGREWEYPTVVVSLKAAILHSIMEYNRRWQLTIAEQVACRLIYELCMKS